MTPTGPGATRARLWLLLLLIPVALLVYIAAYSRWVANKPAPQIAQPLEFIVPPPAPLEAAPPAPTVIAVAPAPAGVSQQTFAPPKAFAATVVRQVRLPAGAKLIALTFDDGPWPVTTQEDLDILRRYNARATFFWVGRYLRAYPKIAQQVILDGHAVGNHSWSHLYHPFTPAAAAQELDSTSSLITQDTEVSTRLFRPPGGSLKNGLASYALKQGYTVVMWSVSSADTDPKAPWTAFAANVLNGARPGAIVLMHDGGGNRSRTTRALPVILEGLQKQGYRFVTIPELLEAAQSGPALQQAHTNPAPHRSSLAGH
ncbi:MAG: polysaccharide deacetylase family protein [Thermaceae bacterium]|nr:polysaccharide deacetylase family protein [Thermaceae bacterium]